MYVVIMKLELDHILLHFLHKYIVFRIPQMDWKWLNAEVESLGSNSDYSAMLEDEKLKYFLMVSTSCFDADVDGTTFYGILSAPKSAVSIFTLAQLEGNPGISSWPILHVL